MKYKSSAALEKYKDIIFLIIRFTKDNWRLTREIAYVIAHRFVRVQTKVNLRKCHFLICKDSKYVNLSKYSVFSLLKHNSDFRVVIHCDDNTYSKTKKFYNFLSLFDERIQIVNDVPNDSYPYVAKGFLFLSLQGTNDIFIDVDTRINGSIPQIRVPTAFVAEFKFIENPKLLFLLRALDLEYSQDQYMLNVTFFCWGSKNPGISKFEFQDWSTRYFEVDWDQIMNPEEIVFYKRFVEQIFFSVKLQESDYELLKSNDRVRDSGLIESSYFGASGSRFGR